MIASSYWPAQNVGGWNGIDLPLSNCAKLRSDDIELIHEHMSSMLCPHDLYTEGGVPPIAFRHNQAALRSLSFNATDYGNPYGQVVVAIPPMKDLCIVQMTLAGEARITQGNESFLLRAGEMCVLGSNHMIRQVFNEGYKHFSVKIPIAELDGLLTDELGYRPGELRFSPRPLRLEGVAATFAQMIRTICDDIDQGRTGYNHPRTAGSAEDILKRLLLAAVPHNHSALFDGSGPPPAPFYVWRVEEYIRSHADQPISLGDLISVSGVSGRSLHAGFRRFRDITPMGYLKNHRLALARAALAKGLDRGLSVTDVALECGFTHLSRFARDYFDRYGELPSATLRRLH